MQSEKDVTTTSNVAPANVRRAEANRRNAQKSTGPRDTTKTRKNAVSHGLLASGPTARDGEELDVLVARLIAQLKPVGILEETEVERLALLTVRLRRTKHLEDGYFANLRENATRSAERQHSITSELMKYLCESDRKPARVQVVTLLKSIMGLANRVETVDDGAAILEDVVELLPCALGAPSATLPEPANVVDRSITNADNPTLRELAGSLSELVFLLETNPELMGKTDESKEALTRIKRLVAPAVQLVERSQAESPAAFAGVSITADVIDALNRLQRYETSLENQYGKVLHRLERLQRLRSGEFVPAPVVVDVSVHDDRQLD